MNNVVIQLTLFLLMVSFFSIGVQDLLYVNNCKLLDPLYFYTNFIFLNLLTYSSKINLPLVLMYFCGMHLIISSLKLYTGFFLKMIWGPFHQCHFLPFEYIHSLPSPLSMSVHYTMWSQKNWTLQGEDMQVCLFRFFCYYFIYLTCPRNV